MRIDNFRWIHRGRVSRDDSSAYGRWRLCDTDQRLQEIGLFVIAYIADIACSSFYLHSNVYFIITKLLSTLHFLKKAAILSWGRRSNDLFVVVLIFKMIKDIITDYCFILKYEHNLEYAQGGQWIFNVRCYFCDLAEQMPFLFCFR